MDKKLYKEVSHIKNLIIYDRSKTLNENSELSEQWEYLRGLGDALGMYGYRKNSDGTTGYQHDGSIQQRAIQKVKDSEFHHYFLPLAAIVISVTTGGIGGIVLAGLVEAADAYLYYREGDTTSAALTTIFMAIPAGALISRIPGVKNLIKELGEGAIGNLLKKVYDRLPLNAAERKVVNEIAEHQDELYHLAIRYANIAEKTAALMEMGLRGIVILLLNLSRIPIFTLKWTIRIGGVLYTGNELLYRLTQYYDIKWEEQWGQVPTLTEEQKAVSDEELVKSAEKELTDRATTQIKTLSTSEEEVIIKAEDIFKSIDVNKYVID